MLLVYRLMKMSWWCFAVSSFCAVVFCADAQLEVIKGYDPGRCDSPWRGKNVLVKNRNGDDLELICVEEKAVFLWVASDGSSTLGEFFNPAFDCSSVLDENPEAKNGYYWVNFLYLKRQKIWCDMVTDGGGFMLIGKKNTPQTWTVPSNSNPVELYGDPHWLSSVGNAPMMDFRVQVATSENLKATKAHWFYRFTTKRKVKQLLMKTTNCSYGGAGISDIAYVKDLQTSTIVSHNLSCSMFGLGFQKDWASMNECLEKPCPWGYRKEKDSQHDAHGAFSYSVNQRVSGMAYGATAFIGCDDKECCGCFGPVGGTDDYCYQSCSKARNDGTVTKNAYTWFWVRSSLPKIAWKKCMPFQVMQNGKLFWYKFVGDSVVPIKGFCNEHYVNLIDGIAVVPKGKTIDDAIPPVNGLLAYRKENKEIYLRSEGKWSALAQKDEIQKELPALVKPSLKNLEDKINSQTNQILSKVHQEVNPKLDKLNERIDVESRSISNKINAQVKPKLDQLDGRVRAQNKSLFQKLLSIESELTSLKKSFEPLTTPVLPIVPVMCKPGNYRWLTESSRYFWHVTQLPAKCDNNLQKGWYRFGGEAGTQIATACVGINRCGAHAPGWMDGPHPTVAEGIVIRTVYFNWNDYCRNWSTHIRVVNCGGFYVYELTPPPTCKLRYCGSAKV